jgi:hypothetical protein
VLGAEAVNAMDVQLVEQQEEAELFPPRSQASPLPRIPSPQHVLKIVLV